MVPSARTREALLYLTAVVLTALALIWALQLWNADLSVPFAYSWDALSNGAITRGMVDTGGWYLTNPAVGAPGVLDMRDFPQADGAHYAALWLIGRLVGDWAVTVNVYYLLAFLLTSAAALWALRRIGLSRPMTLLGAVLFTFLPYHLFRGQDHLFLGAYYAVPLAAVFAYDAACARPLLRRDTSGGWEFDRLRLIGAVLAAVVVGSADVYYAFFGCALLSVGAIIGWMRSRDRYVLASAAGVIVSIALIAALNIAPSIAYRMEAGANPALGGRNPGAAEVYGLKIDQMLLPADGHRIPAFAAIKRLYREGLRQMGPYMDNESVGSSLGIIGSLGFVALMVFAVAGAGGVRLGVRLGAGPGADLVALSSLALTAVLLATVGGFGAIIAVVLPQIRGYNRISVFIALFAFAAVGTMLDRATARLGARGSLVLWLAAMALLGFGLWDQVTPSAVPAHGALRATYFADQAYLRRVEGALPDGSAVFQLPYSPWPEPGGPIGEMNDYDHFRAYLASSGTLRFSYGAMKGREADATQRELASQEPGQMTGDLKAEGFSAVWIDLAGYADDAQVLDSWREASQASPIVSEDGRFAVFVLGR